MLKPKLPECSGLDLNGEGESVSAMLVLHRLQRVLGVEVKLDSGTSAHAAILQASALSGDQAIIELPHWLKCPNKYSRNWIAYSLLAAGVGYGAIFLVKCDPAPCTVFN